MSLPPSEIPLGAMRFNSDSSKLEYWNGSAWFQIHTFSPNLGDYTNSTDSLGGVRGLFAGRFNDTSNNATIDYVTISTQGDAADFGDMTAAGQPDGAGNSIRGIFSGGVNPSYTLSLIHI